MDAVVKNLEEKVEAGQLELKEEAQPETAPESSPENPP